MDKYSLPHWHRKPYISRPSKRQIHLILISLHQKVPNLSRRHPSHIPPLIQITDMEKVRCKCRRPDGVILEGKHWCQGCAELIRRPPDDDVPDPRSTMLWAPNTTPRSSLNLWWPSRVQFEDHLDIEGDRSVAESVANLLRGRDNVATPANIDTPVTLARDEIWPPYRYSALPESPEISERTFRLLHLCPICTEGPVHGTLQTYTFGKAPKYEALSYTWSGEYEDWNQRRGRPLFLDNNFRRLAVTSNCEAALKVLRSRRKEYVWIDAICINQDDDREKENQISLMHQIYAYAEKVLVYVGPRSPKGSEGLALSILRQEADDFKKSLSSNACVQSLEVFFSRSYFSRIWVIQEVNLAKDAMVYCGDEQVEWHQIKTKGSDQTVKDKINVPAWIGRCGGTRNILEPYELGDWIFSGMASHASDPRDKVFAFFGMIENPIGWTLVVDQNLTVEQVYTGIAAYLISEGCVWNVLKKASCDRSDKSDVPHLDLPSWVPDLRCEAPFPLHRWLAEIDPKLQPRLPSQARPIRFLRTTGSLVISGHKLFGLPSVTQLEDRHLLEAPSFGVRFLLEAPSDPMIDGARQLGNSTILLHVRETNCPYAFTLVGRSIFQITRVDPPALTFPGNSMPDDMVPLGQTQFNTLWTVYRYMRSIKSDIAVLRSHWGSKQEILPDSETAWRDYQRLCASPPRRHGAHLPRVSHEPDLQEGLEVVLKFREFWEDRDRVEIWSNRVIITRLTAWVNGYGKILPAHNHSRYLELFGRWKTSMTKARNTTQQFLDGFRNSVASSSDIAIREIEEWRDATLELLDVINYRQHIGKVYSLPKVNFESHLYPHEVGFEGRHKIIELTEYPLRDGYIMYLHEMTRFSNSSLARFCRQERFSSQDGTQALLGDWTNVGDWLWLLTTLDQLSDGEQSAFKEVGCLERDLEQRAKWRTEVSLGKGEEETFIII
ncbi:heterokaryon incompatibility protein-domain-containing protein [Fusarium oxysporum f. sp. albedinis]|nr:heterokaryon incompatibility protein-domain-containing protein [Fusarium oxysporum f. sp. albedinis]